MTVEAIRLKNFMAFEDTDWVELRPITLLFGRNSSGKSAVIRALRLLKQSLDATDHRSALLFSSARGIDLGPYWETVHRIPGQGKPQEDEMLPRMTFGLRCGLTESLDELWDFLAQYLSARGEGIPAREDLPRVVEVELVFEAARNIEQAILSEVQVRYVIARHRATQSINVFSALRLGDDDAYTFGEEWWFASDLPIVDAESGSDFWRGRGIETDNGYLPRLVPPTRQHNFVDQLLGDIAGAVMRFLRQIVHLGPIRPHPRRAFAFERMKLDALANAGWRGMVRLLREDVNEDALAGIDAWLRTTKLARELHPDRLSNAVDVGVLTQLSLIEESGLVVNLADVGFGTSQVIPILVECYTAQRGDLIIIEQPELHLHPRAQAQLGDIFVEMAQQGVRFFIETHSEHLALRLQKQIARTTTGGIPAEERRQMLLPNQLAVYFVNRKGGVSIVSQIEVGTYGDLMSTPEGFEDFFSDDMIETVERTRARLSGMRKGS